MGFRPANYKLANANAQLGVEPATITALPKADDAGDSIAEPQFVFMRDPHLPNMVQGSDVAADSAYRVRGVNTHPSTHAVSMLLRPWDQTEAERFVGTHGVLGRAPVGQPGDQLPWDLPTRAIFRPTPQAWDSGFERYS